MNTTTTPHSGNDTIGVFLLDDHEVVRRGLRQLIDTQPDMTVVGEASTATEATGRIPATAPTVAVLDIRLPDGDGIEVCRDIRSTHPHIACLMLTSYPDDEAVYAAILAGASGYILKQVRANDLIDAIRRVGHGESLLDPAITSRVLERLRQTNQTDELAHLTPQERQLLDHIAQGLTNRQIGQRMYLAEKTIKNYVSNLLAKLGMNRRSQIAAYGARLQERQHPTHQD